MNKWEIKSHNLSWVTELGSDLKPAEPTDSQHSVGGESPDGTWGKDVNPKFGRCEKSYIKAWVHSYIQKHISRT